MQCEPIRVLGRIARAVKPVQLGDVLGDDGLHEKTNVLPVSIRGSTNNQGTARRNAFLGGTPPRLIFIFRSLTFAVRY